MRGCIDKLGVSLTVVGRLAQRDLDVLNEIVGMPVAKGFAVADLLGRVVGVLAKHIVPGLVQKGRGDGRYLCQQLGRRSGHGGKLAGTGLLDRIATQPAADEIRECQATYEAPLELR
jgi:hypothetical protein